MIELHKGSICSILHPMKPILRNFKKNFFVLIGLLCISTSAFGEYINVKGKEPPIAKEHIFRNQSILSCGPRRKATVLTYVDVKALLVISNTFSQKKVPLTTNWQTLSTPRINLNKISSTIPKDIIRVLFLCLNWEDTQLGNLYNVPEEELDKNVEKVKLEKPWRIYPKPLQEQISHLSNEQFAVLVHIVLRAEASEKAQGSLEDNTSVKSVVYSWLL